MSKKLVSDLMTRDVRVIKRESDVHDLEKLLLENRVHGLPVVDEGQRLVGVISQTDLLAWHYNTSTQGCAFYDYTNLLVQDAGDLNDLRLADSLSAHVGEIMSTVVHSIAPEAPVAAAAAEMVNRRIHRLVVVDREQRVLGIVSALDLLRAIPDAQELLATEES